MKPLAIAVLLGVGVAAAWLAASGFVRLPRALDRLHVLAFVNVACGGAVTVAALLADGLSQRTGKIALIWVAMLVAGALTSHASARALLLRGSTDQGR